MSNDVGPHLFTQGEFGPEVCRHCFVARDAHPVTCWVESRPMSGGTRWGRWLCRRLGWHPQRYREFLSFGAGDDMMVERARCRRCGFVGMEDSQGNLF